MKNEIIETLSKGTILAASSYAAHAAITPHTLEAWIPRVGTDTTAPLVIVGGALAATHAMLTLELEEPSSPTKLVKDFLFETALMLQPLAALDALTLHNESYLTYTILAVAALGALETLFLYFYYDRPLKDVLPISSLSTPIEYVGRLREARQHTT